MGPSVLCIDSEAGNGATEVLHQPTSSTLKKEIERILSGDEGLSVQVCGDVEALWADFRSHFKWIEAAGGIVTGPDGRILMIHRLGHWDLPKGKLEKGESADAGALREVEEECGIGHLRISGEPIATYHTYPYKGGNALKQTLWYPMRTEVAQVPVAQQEEDISDAVWCTVDEVRHRLPQAYPAIRLILEQVPGLKGSKAAS